MAKAARYASVTRSLAARIGGPIAARIGGPAELFEETYVVAARVEQDRVGVAEQRAHKGERLVVRVGRREDARG